MPGYVFDPVSVDYPSATNNDENDGENCINAMVKEIADLEQFTQRLVTAATKKLSLIETRKQK